MPSDMFSNLSTLAVDRAFSSSSCHNTTSADFRAASDITFCKSEITDAPLALFIGNSHGAMLQDAMAESLNELGYSVDGIFTSSCTISPHLIPVLNNLQLAKCKFFGEDIAHYIAKTKPALTVVSQDLRASFLNTSGAPVFGVQSEDILVSNLEKTFKSLRNYTSRVVLLDAFPQFPNVIKCIGPTGHMNNCVTRTEDTGIYRSINKAISDETGAALISPLTWVCYSNRCPAIISDTLVSPDGSHVTPEFALLLKPQLKQSLMNVLK
jgi:hypothetical protein